MFDEIKKKITGEMDKRKTEEEEKVNEKFRRKYKGKRVILKSGQVGKLVGWEDFLIFDSKVNINAFLIEIDDIVYIVTEDNIIGIEKKEESGN